MLIIDGTINSEVSAFLARLQEETLAYKIIPYTQWLEHADCQDHHEHPKGIIYLRVMPEIALKRIQQTDPTFFITLEHIQQIYTAKDELFIQGKHLPPALHNLPVLVLNGNIDFQTDFAQFYNHLFYIKRLINQIQEKEEKELGIYKEKVYRRCC
jgi:hypothetical protein